MKIEKISETQIKFVLSRSDLTERDIKLTEIQFGSEKTQALFREMMEQAMIECDFHVDNTPLMIEAVPASADSIMIIVTKVSNSEKQGQEFNLLPFSRDAGRYKSHDVIETPIEEICNEDNISIFSFNNLDDAASASLRLWGYFTGESQLYKNGSRYFLTLRNHEYADKSATEELESILNEYGQKHISTVISKYYLVEHGELLIGGNAVNIMAEHLA